MSENTPTPTPTDDSEGVQAFGEIIQKDATKQIVTGPILIPGQPDREGDIISKDNVEAVAHDYLATHRHVDEMHDEVGRADHAVVESYIAPDDLEINGQTIRKGTWMGSVKLGDEAWERVESGDYTGFSIQGEGRRYYGRGGPEEG